MKKEKKKLTPIQLIIGVIIIIIGVIIGWWLGTNFAEFISI